MTITARIDESEIESVKQTIINNTIRHNGGCWMWTRSTRGNGYGQITLARRKQGLAHRYAYMAFVGPIHDWALICHKCDNPLCCNPDHLFQGTAKDNTLDCVAKGRLNPGRVGGPRKLAESDKLSIKALYGSGILQKEIAAKFGVTQVRISQIVRSA